MPLNTSAETLNDQVLSPPFDQGTLVTKFGDDELDVRVLSPRIVRVTFLRGGQNDPPTPMVDSTHVWPGDPKSTLDEMVTESVVKTSAMQVEVFRKNVWVNLLDRNGNFLLRHPKEGGVFVDDPKSPGGPDGGVRFQHAPGQRFYGIKAYSIDNYDNAEAPAVQGPDSLLRNGVGVKDNTYQACASTQGGAGGPLVWTTAGYGLLVDSDNGYFRITDDKLEFRYGHPKDRVDNGRHYHRNNSVQYYLIAGTPKEILASVAEITGRAPMFPRWAMGFTNSQWGSDQWEFYRIADNYRARDIPIDNFTFDYDWKSWGEDHYGEFRWNGDKFPDAYKPAPDGKGSLLKANAAKQGFVMTGIMKPRIVLSVNADGDQPRTEQAKAAADFGYPGVECHKEYLPPFRFIRELDFTKPACRQWFWEAVRDHGAIPGGIVGFWNDEADCTAVFDPHKAQVFNNFGHFQMEQGLYEGQRAAGKSPAKTPRAWSISRNFYLGAQRFAYGMWSGDIHTGWESMRRQTVRMLSAIAVGEAKWGMDTGGFVGDDCDPENYARWIQFSALVPIFRVHGDHRHQRQPWTTDSIMAEEIAKNAIQLRYRLGPYIYACDRQGYETGTGLVRPLMIEFPDDPGSANVTDQWMFGDWLLAAPVLRQQFSQENTATCFARPVYLPPGQWIDYFRGRQFEGGRTISYACNPGVWSDIPLFVRRGAILFTQDVFPSLGQARPTQIYVDAFPGKTATGATFYDDDGTTYAYEEGNFSKQRITVRDDGTTASLTVAARSGPYQGSVKSFFIRIHGRAAQAVTLDGNALPPAANLVALRTDPQGWTVVRDVYGPATIIKLPAGLDAAQKVELTGSQQPTNTAETLWAADASLSGETPQTRPQLMGPAPSYVAGLDTIKAGVTFTPKVALPGYYDVTLMAGNIGNGPATLSIFVNGVPQGRATVPPQPGANTWATFVLPLKLAAGNNIITLRRKSEDTGEMAIGNLAVPFQPAKALYEAEGAELLGGATAAANHRNYTGAGFVDHLDAAGAGVQFKVFAPKTGDYTLTTRYANGSSQAQAMSLYVDGAMVDAEECAPTENWDTWREISQTLKLDGGVHTVAWKRAAAGSGGLHLDSLAVEPQKP